MPACPWRLGQSRVGIHTCSTNNMCHAYGLAQTSTSYVSTQAQKAKTTRLWCFSFWQSLATCLEFYTYVHRAIKAIISCPSPAWSTSSPPLITSVCPEPHRNQFGCRKHRIFFQFPSVRIIIKQRNMIAPLDYVGRTGK